MQIIFLFGQVDSYFKGQLGFVGVGFVGQQEWLFQGDGYFYGIVQGIVYDVLFCIGCYGCGGVDMYVYCMMLLLY